MSKILIYQDSNNQIELNVQLEGETVWLTQAQMVELFESSKANISEHITNILVSGELDEERTVRKFRTVRQEGNREVKRNLIHYNLDMIISIGYRVNSARGIQFGRWATIKLRELLVQGYVLNEKRLEQKSQEVKILKSGIQIIGRAIEQKANEDMYAWLKTFAKELGVIWLHIRMDTRPKYYKTKMYKESDFLNSIN